MFRCIDNGVVSYPDSASGRRALKRGNVHTPDDPVVRMYPHLFVEITSTDPALEDASANPGAKRNTRRKAPAKKKAAPRRGSPKPKS